MVLTTAQLSKQNEADKRVHFAATPTQLARTTSVTPTPSTSKAPHTFTPTAIASAYTGTPRSDWQNLLVSARARLRDTPPPVASSSGTGKPMSERSSATSTIPGVSMESLSFVAELKTHKLKKAPKPPPKEKERSKEPSLLGL